MALKTWQEFLQQMEAEQPNSDQASQDLIKDPTKLIPPNSPNPAQARNAAQKVGTLAKSKGMSLKTAAMAVGVQKNAEIK